MAGPSRARGHVIHAHLSSGTLVTSTSTGTNTTILSSGTYEQIIIENRGSGSFRLTGSTGSTEGLSFSTGSHIIFEHVVPFNALYAHPTSTRELKVMVQIST